ncbi:MAG TPA: O-antigen ligase family protein [Phycisphaerales bacterium]|nr:O-antigen ligase family protein [Phycisphaerales bacterium]
MKAGAAGVLRWAGTVAVLVGVIVPACTAYTSLPGWDMDPLIAGAPRTGLGPGAMMTLHALALAGAGLALAGHVLGGGRLHRMMIVLGALGGAGAAWHVFLAVSGTLESQVAGVAWLAGVGAGLALAHAGADARLRRVVAAVLLGLVGVLALRGVQQVMIEHPATVAAFSAAREEVLAAQGWTPGSPMALSYERRLLQPEATGWFGLANVQGTFAAWGVVTALGLVAAWWSARWRGQTGARRLAGGAAAALTVLALVALALGGSRTGFVAAAGGLGALALLWAGSGRAGRRWLAVVAALAALAGPTALVALRAGVGDRLGELSLLYRWFYVQAVARVAWEHPLVGVGPGNFQRAYLTAKNPLSPEEVSSAHNLLLDWWAGLGVLGLAWAALLAWWVVRAGVGALGCGAGAGAVRPGRGERRAVAGVAALVTLAAAWSEPALTTPDAALVRVLGLALWAGLGVLALDVLGLGRARLAEAAGVLALVAASQMDVAGSWAQSAPLVIVLVGVAAARTPHAPDAVARRRAGAGLLVAMALGVGAGAAGWSARQAISWERALDQAAALARPIGRLRGAITGALGMREPSARQAAISAAASAAAQSLQRPVPATRTGLDEALLSMEHIALPTAYDWLLEARRRLPRDWRAAREASRIALRYAQLQQARGEADKAGRWLDEAARLAESTGPLGPSQAGWAALALEAGADLAGTADPAGARATLARAAGWRARAFAGDPYNPDHPRRLAELHDRLGEPEAAARWARAALDLDRAMRYDREVRALRPDQRARLEALLEP